MSVILYYIKRGNDWFVLHADFKDGCLVLEGCDFCDLAESMFGDEEYEYTYRFDKENNVKLANVLSSQDLLASLIEFFDGKMRNENFFFANNTRSSTIFPPDIDVGKYNKYLTFSINDNSVLRRSFNFFAIKNGFTKIRLVYRGYFLITT